MDRTKLPMTVAEMTATPEFHKINDHVAVVFADSMEVVAVVGPAGDEESIRFAKLFAAAPDLLAVCQAAMRIVSLWCPPDQGAPEHAEEDAALHEMRIGIEAAIARATKE